MAEDPCRRSRQRLEVLPVYLIHYGAPEWCARAVASLLTSEGVTIEVTVVDNGGGGELERLLPPEVRVIHTGRNLGFAGGANLAIDDWRSRYANGEWLLVGSHDLHVQPGALKMLVDVASESERNDVGIYAPFVEGREHRIPRASGAEVVEVEWASGTCLMLRRACLDDVVGFDERFGSYGEDMELCRRASRHGWSTAVVLASRAHGLGTAHPMEQHRLSAVNTVLWGYIERGRVGASVELVRLAAKAVYGLLVSCLPARMSVDRNVAVRVFATRGKAMVQAAWLLMSGRWSRNA